MRKISSRFEPSNYLLLDWEICCEKNKTALPYSRCEDTWLAVKGTYIWFPLFSHGKFDFLILFLIFLKKKSEKNKQRNQSRPTFA